MNTENLLYSHWVHGVAYGQSPSVFSSLSSSSSFVCSNSSVTSCHLHAPGIPVVSRYDRAGLQSYLVVKMHLEYTKLNCLSCSITKRQIAVPIISSNNIYSCGWGGRVVVLQPECRQFPKNLHAEVSLSKMLNPELCLIEQQSAANRCTVWMCVWLGECKTVL